MSEQPLEHSPKTIPLPGKWLWYAMWLCLLVGFSSNFYLAYHHWSSANSGASSAMVGCGMSGFDCDRVLSSPYGQLLGISITYFAFAYYLLLIPVLFLTRKLDALTYATPRSTILPVVSSISVITAIWAVVTMIEHIGAYCLWCLVVHAANCLFFILSLMYVSAWWEYRLQQRESDAGQQQELPPLGNAASFGGLVLAVGLSLFQLFILSTFHDEAKVEVANLPDNPVEILSLDADKADAAKKESSVIWTSEGNTDADQQLVMIGCYTCPHCKHLHEGLSEVLKKYPNEFRVDLRLNPLSAGCNKTMADYTPTRHRYACEAAKSVLAVTKVAPEQFADYSQWLFERQDELTPYMMDQEGMRRVGEKPYRKAFNSEEVKTRVAHDVHLSNQIKLETVPQLYLPNRRLDGAGWVSKEQLEKILIAALGLGQEKSNNANQSFDASSEKSEEQ